MNWLFLFFPFPLFSQSVFQNSIKNIIIDNKHISDIESVQGGDVAPIIYINNPNFSNLPVSEKKIKFIDFILPAILLEKEKIYLSK